MNKLLPSRNHLCGISFPEHDRDELEDRLPDKRAWPVADAVAFQIDFASFLSTLSYRDRTLLRFLARGNTVAQAAAKFNLSPGLVKSLRDRWWRQWHAMQGEDIPA
jgi:hypothetical protein